MRVVAAAKTPAAVSRSGGAQEGLFRRAGVGNAQRGISEGDWVFLETPEGRVRARARLNENLDPQVVSGQHGWW
jgi:hypothetical protein